MPTTSKAILGSDKASSDSDEVENALSVSEYQEQSESEERSESEETGLTLSEITSSLQTSTSATDAENLSNG